MVIKNLFLSIFLSFAIFSYPLAYSNYYVVIQSFSKIDLAEKYQKKIQQKGYQAKIIYNSERGFYYVYFEESVNYKTALKEKEIIRASGFENAWIYNK